MSDFNNAETLCSDPASLKDSEAQLVRTFELALPTELKAEALRCYMESHLLTMLDSFKPLVDAREFEQAYNMLDRSNTEIKRKKSRFAQVIEEKSKSNSESVTTHNAIGILDIQQKQLILRQERSEVDDSANAANIALQEGVFEDTWTMPYVPESPFTQSIVQPASAFSTFSSDGSPNMSFVSKNLPEWNELFFATPNDLDASDRLHAVQPECLPVNPPQSLSKGLPGVLKESCKPAHLPHEAEQIVQQPAYTTRGTFEQDILDPSYGPSYASDSCPPSVGLGFEEALFDFSG